MAIETKKYLDLAGLTHFWENIKDYVDNSSNTAKDKIDKIAEEVELDRSSLEYTGVYDAANSVRADIVAAKGEIEELSGAITDMKGLSYDEIDTALAATAPEVDPNA